VDFIFARTKNPPWISCQGRTKFSKTDEDDNTTSDADADFAQSLLLLFLCFFLCWGVRLLFRGSYKGKRLRYVYAKLIGGYKNVVWSVFTDTHTHTVSPHVTAVCKTFVSFLAPTTVLPRSTWKSVDLQNRIGFIGRQRLGGWWLEEMSSGRAACYRRVPFYHRSGFYQMSRLSGGKFLS
jgi:hypothetical protein